MASRILIVDDEKSILFAMEKYFAQCGFIVDTADDPEQAELLILENRYDVAIIDVHLTHRTDFTEGLEVAARLRKIAPATAVILMSALGTPETERRATEIGAHSFLRKPARMSCVANLAFDLMRSVFPVA